MLSICRDPEFVLYEGAVDTMNIYKVKPAIFDLILALCIAAYLGLIYVFVVVRITLIASVSNVVNYVDTKSISELRHSAVMVS